LVKEIHKRLKPMKGRLEEAKEDYYNLLKTAREYLEFTQNEKYNVIKFLKHIYF